MWAIVNPLGRLRILEDVNIESKKNVVRMLGVLRSDPNLSVVC